jgi:hypothetical protein
MFCQFDPQNGKKRKERPIGKYLPERKANFLPLNQHLHLEVYLGSQNMQVWISKMVLAQHFCTVCCCSYKALESLTFTRHKKG